MSLQPKTMDEGKVLKERVSSIAMGEAIKYSVFTTMLVGGGTILAIIKNKNFKKYMSTSARMSLPVMTGLGVFSFKYEMVFHDAMINPERWGLKDYIEDGKITKMPIHHQALNYLYDHPFHFVSGVGFPFAAAILNQQLKLQHLDS